MTQNEKIVQYYQLSASIYSIAGYTSLNFTFLITAHFITAFFPTNNASVLTAYLSRSKMSSLFTTSHGSNVQPILHSNVQILQPRPPILTNPSPRASQSLDSRSHNASSSSPCTLGTSSECTRPCLHDCNCVGSAPSQILLRPIARTTSDRCRLAGRTAANSGATKPHTVARCPRSQTTARTWRRSSLASLASALARDPRTPSRSPSRCEARKPRRERFPTREERLAPGLRIERSTSAPPSRKCSSPIGDSGTLGADFGGHGSSGLRIGVRSERSTRAHSPRRTIPALTLPSCVLSDSNNNAAKFDRCTLRE